MLSLGIDGGASSAKWAVIDQSQTIIFRGDTGAIDGHLYRPESLERFNACLTEIKRIVGDSVIDAITIGITGFGSQKAIHEQISTFFPGALISSSTDIALAYRGEFESGEGIFLYAGTGSVAIHITQEDKEITAGGWGYLLGDEGGGFWIGREALRHLARNAESGNLLDELSQEIGKIIGGTTWSDIREFTYSKNRSEIAKLSRIVVSLAEAGDQVSLNIISEAAQHLADLVQRLDLRLGGSDLPVKFGGGMSNAIPKIRLEVERVLGRSVVLGTGDYALTAARIGISKG